MTHTYHISGMTCTGCQAKVQLLLSGVDHVNKVSIDLAKGFAAVTMDQHVPTAALQAALADYPKYQLTAYNAEHPKDRLVPDPLLYTEMPPETPHASNMASAIDPGNNTSFQGWLRTYKPILLIFSFITGVSILRQFSAGHFDPMEWMYDFMAGFFLVFAFFKLLNLSGFSSSYAMYDVVARRWPAWGFIYPFAELLLGIAFLLRWQPLATNAITLVIMSISLIGVLQSVFNKRKIRCACLGDVFNLPMSTVTIVEDGLMIGMSAIMLLFLL